MRLRTKYILFVSLIHIVLIILSLNLMKDKILLFLAAEVVIFITIIISILLYRQLIRPINTITSGIESIEDKDFSMKFVKVGHYEMDKLIDVYNTMIDQLRVERVKQQEQHFFLENLIEATPSGIVILDFDERIISVNPAAEEFIDSKIEELEGKIFAEVPGKLAKEISKIESSLPVVVPISGMKTFRCQKACFVDRGFNNRFVVIEELTEELLKTERAAYEKVIRMMSHEINNSIGAVNSILNSSLNYSDQIAEGDRTYFVDAMNVAIRRNEHLNKFMRNFADIVRIPEPKKTRADLHELLKTVQLLISSQIGEKEIKWKWDLSDNGLITDLDIHQIEQVLVNILKNAVEAIDKKGEVIIQTQQHPKRRLMILNNGEKISNETQQKLFTPFFSTKAGGQGLGLTLIREILLNHGFNFSLNTYDDGYTVFMIEF
ncbi:MAG: GHKL domain-containing protein [Candidatus Cloacimonetes bacterium]|nr:GHKL domain-containing protein [Candidatus Cloacimonadota bacterium]